MNARLQNRVYQSQRRIRRNRELDRADTFTLWFAVAGIVAAAAAGWLATT